MKIYFGARVQRQIVNEIALAWPGSGTTIAMNFSCSIFSHSKILESRRNWIYLTARDKEIDSESDFLIVLCFSGL